MRKTLKAILPARVRRSAIRVWESAFMRRIRYFGLRHRCPICGAHLSKFVDYGQITVLKAEECPCCGSHRRHRTIWLYFDKNYEKLFPTSGERFLEVAPMRGFSERFRKDPRVEYLSADLKSPLAMVKMDLTAIQYPDNYFDAIYCSHVLEHIPDDMRAMKELFRVLKVGGWAILQVPIDLNRAKTYEDESIQSPEDRAREFGQADHVRFYGRDYKDRLEAAGFSVTLDEFVKDLPQGAVRKFGLDPLECIYYCEKRPPAANASAGRGSVTESVTPE